MNGCFKPHWVRWLQALRTKNADFYEGHAFVNLFAEGLRCRSTRWLLILIVGVLWVAPLGIEQFYPVPIFMALVSMLIPNDKMLAFIKLRIPKTSIGIAHIMSATGPWAIMYVPILIAYLKNKR